MDKRQLKRELSQSVKGAAVISCMQVERFLGFGHNKTVNLLKGLDAIEVNDRKKYFISDVAERILERMIRT